MREATCYSLWKEETNGEIRWFWIVDDDEEIIDSGIENTREEAVAKIKTYITMEPE